MSLRFKIFGFLLFWLALSITIVASIFYFLFSPNAELIRSDNLRTSISWLGVIPIILSVFIALAVTGILITNLLLNPIEKLSDAVRQKSAGQPQFILPTQENGTVGIVAQTLDKLQSNLQATPEIREEQIDNRIQSLSSKVERLLSATEVAHEISATRSLNLAMNLTMNLMIDRFGYEHIEIYLVDPQGEFAVLRAASGEAGSVMLAQGYRLRLGSASPIGSVALTGEPRIISDTESDPSNTRNPLLRLTRSEIAVPLIWNQHVIGVLDVQDSRENMFNKLDLDIGKIVANQLAISVETSKLYQENIEIKQQLAFQHDRLRQNTWGKPFASKAPLGFQFDVNGIHPLTPDPDERKSEEAPYSFPVRIHGEVMAWLDVWPPGAHMAPGEEELLTLLGDRLGHILESVQIFEEAQRRAARQERVNQIMTNVRSSSSLDGILRNTVSELGRVFGASKSFIEIGMPPDVNEEKER
jgi:nitrate/nitrite-specific signal transduction histidine kinase